MRAVFTYLVVFLLLACPLFCKAGDDGCCANGEVTGDSTGEQHAPGLPDDAATCICGGAIKATDNRIHGPGPEDRSPSPDTFQLDCIAPHRFSLSLPLARGGRSSVEDGWPGSRRFHALFQHFRC